MTAPAKTGPWDAAEDELLYKYQAVYGNKWSEVARHIPGRTGQQCAQRWRHKVNPNILREKWSAAEDATLVQLVGQLGHRWAEIARHLPGRTDQQCLGRWRRHLDPSVRRTAWSAEEDALLLALHQQLGNAWSAISKRLGARTPQQCRCRFIQLSGNPAPMAGRRSAAGGGSSEDAEWESCDEDEVPAQQLQHQQELMWAAAPMPVPPPQASPAVGAAACRGSQGATADSCATGVTPMPPTTRRRRRAQYSSPEASSGNSEGCTTGQAGEPEVSQQGRGLATVGRRTMGYARRPRTTQFRARVTCSFPRRSPSPGYPGQLKSLQATTPLGGPSANGAMGHVRVSADAQGLLAGEGCDLPSPCKWELPGSASPVSRALMGFLAPASPGLGQLLVDAGACLSPAAKAILTPQLPPGPCSPTLASPAIKAAAACEQDQDLAAQAVAAGLLSPSSTNLSNWSVLPPMSWASFGDCAMGLGMLGFPNGPALPGDEQDIVSQARKAAGHEGTPTSRMPGATSPAGAAWLQQRTSPVTAAPAALGSSRRQGRGAVSLAASPAGHKALATCSPAAGQQLASHQRHASWPCPQASEPQGVASAAGAPGAGAVAAAVQGGVLLGAKSPAPVPRSAARPSPVIRRLDTHQAWADAPAAGATAPSSALSRGSTPTKASASVQLPPAPVAGAAAAGTPGAEGTGTAQGASVVSCQATMSYCKPSPRHPDCSPSKKLKTESPVAGAAGPTSAHPAATAVGAAACKGAQPAGYAGFGPASRARSLLAGFQAAEASPLPAQQAQPPWLQQCQQGAAHSTPCSRMFAPPAQQQQPTPDQQHCKLVSAFAQGAAAAAVFVAAPADGEAQPAPRLRSSTSAPEAGPASLQQQGLHGLLTAVQQPQPAAAPVSLHHAPAAAHGAASPWGIMRHLSVDSDAANPAADSLAAPEFHSPAYLAHPAAGMHTAGTAGGFKDPGLSFRLRKAATASALGIPAVPRPSILGLAAVPKDASGQQGIRFASGRLLPGGFAAAGSMGISGGMTIPVKAGPSFPEGSGAVDPASTHPTVVATPPAPIHHDAVKVEVKEEEQEQQTPVVGMSCARPHRGALAQGALPFPLLGGLCSAGVKQQAVHVKAGEGSPDVMLIPSARPEPVMFNFM